jgi:hypothetical protein
MSEQPIQPEYRETMNALAKALDIAFNGDKHGPARQRAELDKDIPF